MPWSPYLLAGGMSLPWAVCTLLGVHPSAPVVAVLTGVSVLGAAFLLSWACEAADMDVPRAFAVRSASVPSARPCAQLRACHVFQGAAAACYGTSNPFVRRA